MNYLKHTFWRHVSIFALLIMVSGCGSPSASGTPIDIHDIPVPPGSTLYEGSYESTIDMMYITTRRAFGVTNNKCVANTLYYIMERTGDGFDEYLSFYQTAFAPTDWQADTAIELSGVQRWTRTSSAGNQSLTAGVIPFTQGDTVDYLLVLVLVTGELPCHN